MALLPDMDGVDATSGGPGQCPAGWHLMAVQGIEEKDKNEKGNVVHVVTFSCLEPEHLGKVAKENFTTTHPVGLSRYKGLVLACGFNEAQLKAKQVSTEMLKGRPVKIFVIEEPFQTLEGKAAKSSKAASWESGADEYRKLVTAATGGAKDQASTPAAATAGAQKEDMGF